MITKYTKPLLMSVLGLSVLGAAAMSGPVIAQDNETTEVLVTPSAISTPSPTGQPKVIVSVTPKPFEKTAISAEAKKIAELRQKAEKAKEQREKDLAKAKELRNKIARQRCEKATARVHDLIEKINDHNEKTNFNELIAKFEKVSALFKTAGLDTSKLDADIKEMKTIISQRANKSSVAAAALQKTQEIQCLDKQQEDKEFKTRFEESKKKIEELNKVARDEASKMKVVLRKIQDDIKTLRGKLVEKRKQTTPTSTPKPSVSPVPTETLDQNNQ